MLLRLEQHPTIMSTVIQILTAVRLKGRLDDDDKLELTAIQTTGEAVKALEIHGDVLPARVELHDFKVGEIDWTFVADHGWERVEAHIEREFQTYSRDEGFDEFEVSVRSNQGAATQTKSKKLYIKIKPVEQGPDNS